MTIQFNSIPPSNLRVPLWYAEINGAQTPYVSISRLLLCGQMTNGGGATPGEPVHVTGDPRTLFGLNSMLVDMVNRARANAPFQEIWALPMLDNASGVAASGQIILPRQLAAAAATTGNIANLETGAPSVVDGVNLVQGDFVLVLWQTDKTKNGLYVVTTLGTGANGVWTRATSMDVSAEFESLLTVTVAGGAINGDKIFRLNRGKAFVLDIDKVEFTEGAMVLAASTLVVWIGDVPVQTIVYVSDTGSTLAARLTAAINVKEGCPVTAAVNGISSWKIDLTVRHKGTAGNSVYLDTDYYGQDGPLASTLFSFVQPSGGTGDPDFEVAFAGLGDDEYDWIVGPYTDGIFMGYVDTLLNGQSGRWSPYKQLYGHYLGVRHGSVSDLMTYGDTYNLPYSSTFGVYRAASPSWKWAGAIGGRLAAHLTEPPELSRPLQTLDLIGILPPKSPSNRPNITDRQSLYFSGISSFHVDGKTKTCSIDRIITNYQVNEWGSPDASWLDVETRAQAMYAIRAMKARVTGQYGRCALMDDNPEGLQGVATVKDIEDTIVHEYKRLWRLGVVDNPGLFQQQLIVERNVNDANRVDIYLPADVVNQLRIVAVNYTSFLQYNQ